MDSFKSGVKRMTYTLENADRYIRENAPTINPKWRPMYHLAAEVGWLNDPNGFIHYKGLYHQFYQHYPYKAEWGPMHWGHATSTDLVKWQYQPVALAPDRAYDQSGCFSGSAIPVSYTHLRAH
ncbi:MAG: hypothetical protein N2376_10680, partial [Clostridia bacterium]|nr:hypothetical protein [Clostridia bacterium]